MRFEGRPEWRRHQLSDMSADVSAKFAAIGMHVAPE